METFFSVIYFFILQPSVSDDLWTSFCSADFDNRPPLRNFETNTKGNAEKLDIKFRVELFNDN